MSKVITNLEKRFNNFINEPRDWDFFIGLAEYAHYLQETPILSEQIQIIMAQKAEDTKGLKEAETKALEAVRTAWKTVLKRIKEKGATTPLLDGLIKEYTDYETGAIRVLNDTPLATSLYQVLANIVRELYGHNNGQYRSLVSDLVTGKVENSHFFIEIFTFGLPLNDVDFEKKILESKKDTAVWYAWEQLNDAYITFYKGWDYIKDKGLWNTKDFNKAWEFVNYKILLEEKEAIKNDRTSGLIFFVRAKYRQYVSRVNHYLLRQLEEVKIIDNNSGTKNSELTFDSNESVLHFQGHDIPIGKTKNSYPHDLLQTIFKEPTKLWNYDEIATDWHNYEYKKEDWKRFYNAAYKINRKVAEKTTIMDFLKPTKLTVNISKKYLS